MKKIFFLLLSFLSVSVNAQELIPEDSANSSKPVRRHMAQYSVSYTSSNYVADNDFIDYSVNLQGVRLGWIENCILAKNTPLYLQFGLGFQYLWGKDDYEKKLSFINATIPVNISYVIRFGNSKVYLEPFAGANFKVNLGASYDNNSMFDKDKFNTTAKRTQFGYQAGMGLGLSRLYIHAGYQGDFTDVSKNDKISGFVIGLGYKF